MLNNFAVNGSASIVLKDIKQLSITHINTNTNNLLFLYTFSNFLLENYYHVQPYVSVHSIILVYP